LSIDAAGNVVAATDVAPVVRGLALQGNNLASVRRRATIHRMADIRSGTDDVGGNASSNANCGSVGVVARFKSAQVIIIAERSTHVGVRAVPAVDEIARRRCESARRNRVTDLR